MMITGLQTDHKILNNNFVLESGVSNHSAPYRIVSSPDTVYFSGKRTDAAIYNGVPIVGVVLVILGLFFQSPVQEAALDNARLAVHELALPEGQAHPEDVLARLQARAAAAGAMVSPQNVNVDDAEQEFKRAIAQTPLGMATRHELIRQAGNVETNEDMIAFLGALSAAVPPANDEDEAQRARLLAEVRQLKLNAENQKEIALLAFILGCAFLVVTFIVRTESI